MIVSKFGGKATISLEAINNIKMLSKNKDRQILVFSAIGKEKDGDCKLTDLFFLYIKAYRSRQNTNKIKERIVEKLSTLARLTKVKMNVEKEFYKCVISFIQCDCDDFLVSRGEYLTALIISKFLKIKFVPSEKLLFYKEGKLAKEKSKKRLDFYLKKYKQIITTGFYAVDENKKIILFSRGGGDESGAIFAKLSRAEIYENWTDSEGIRQVNPSICESNQVMQMSYQELEFITSLDANVINRDCAKLLKNSEIDLYVSSIFSPHTPPTIVSKTQEDKNLFICFSANGNNIFVYLKNKSSCQTFVTTKEELVSFVTTLYKKQRP